MRIFLMKTVGALIALTTALSLNAAPTNRPLPQKKTNAKKAVPAKKMAAKKYDDAKSVAVLEKERSTLLNKYQQRTRRMQNLRERNQSLVASITRLETELETATVRQQALQA